MPRIFKAFIIRPGPRGAPGDMDPAEWDALQADIDAKLPIADVLNEPDMATGAIDKPPSQASVKQYVDARAGIVEPTFLVPLDGDLTGQDGSGAILATANGSARWVDGVGDTANGALLLEPGNSNLITNPYFAVDTSGWVATRATITRTTARAYAGPASGLVTADGGGSAYIRQDRTVPATTHTIRAFVWHDLTGERTFYLRQAGTILATAVIGPKAEGDWTEIRATFTGTAAAAQYRIEMIGPPAAGETFTVGYAGITAGDDTTTPVPAIDASGTVLTGYSWAGTVHNSISTRAEGSLAIPAAAFPANLAVRHSDDGGDTWPVATLTTAGAFGSHGEATFLTDTLTIAPVTQGFRLDAVRGDARTLSTSERDVLATAQPWTWIGLRENPTDLSAYTELDLFEVEHEADGVLRRVARPNDPKLALGSAIPTEREYPTVSKPLDAPVLAFADQPASTIYWPYLVDRRPMGGEGVSIFYSTDHDTVGGGIFAAEGDSPLDTFTARGARVYQDSVAGGQTETPSLIWDASISAYRLYYQNAGAGTFGNQATVLATTADLVTITRVGVVLDKQETIEAGDGHTGYFRPFRIGGTWYGYSLYGGTANSHYALWQSADGVTWYRYPHRLGHDAPLIDHLTGYAAGWRLRWHEGTVIQWRGQPWLITTAGPSAAGGGIATTRVVTAPIAPSLTRLASRVVDITPDAQAWENGGISQIGNALTWEGRMYILYRGTDNNAGGFGVMEVA